MKRFSSKELTMDTITLQLTTLSKVNPLETSNDNDDNAFLSLFITFSFLTLIFTIISLLNLVQKIFSTAQLTKHSIETYASD